MLKARLFSGIGAVVLIAASFLAASPVQAADGKEPPACAAISFRPVVGTPPDGEQDSGLYKSRFVKIELKATVKAGLASNYYLLINGKKPESLSTSAPKSAESCLKAKVHAFPVKTQASDKCTGSRFRVVIQRGGKEKTVMLFGLQGNDWLLCNAAKM